MAKKKQDDADAQPESSDGSIAVNDAWTGMLAVSLLALVVGTGFLAYDYYQYDSDKVPKATNFTATLPGSGAPTPKGPSPKGAEPKDGAAKDGAEKKDAEKKDG